MQGKDRGPVMSVPKGIRPTLSKHRIEVQCRVMDYAADVLSTKLITTLWTVFFATLWTILYSVLWTVWNIYNRVFCE